MYEPESQSWPEAGALELLLTAIACTALGVCMFALVVPIAGVVLAWKGLRGVASKLAATRE